MSEEPYVIGVDFDFDPDGFVQKFFESLKDKGQNELLNDKGQKPEKKEPKPNKNVAACRFFVGPNTEKEYFFNLVDLDVKPGDKVVVDTQFGMQVAVVSEVLAEKDADIKPTKEVVCKIDTSAFDERHKRDERREKIDKAMKLTKEFQTEMDGLQLDTKDLIELIRRWNE